MLLNIWSYMLQAIFPKIEEYYRLNSQHELDYNLNPHITLLLNYSIPIRKTTYTNGLKWYYALVKKPY